MFIRLHQGLVRPSWYPMNDDAEDSLALALSHRARSLVEQWLLSETPHDSTAVAALMADHPELREHLEAELARLQRIEVALGNATFPGSTGVRFGIPGYEIQRRVGAGGQASVFRATQVSTGQTVAIKAIYGGALCSDGAKKRFDREVRILVELNHPHIANVIDRGVTDEGTPFVVIRFVEGQNLDEWLNERRRQAMPNPSRAELNELLQTFVTICNTINAAHQKGIVHRDLKPSNIRIDQRGQPHILDFGLALEAIMDAEAAATIDPAAAKTKTGQFVGSLPWASPEQIGAVDAAIGERSDVYALGLILYDMLAGRLPFETTVSLKELLNGIAAAVKIAPSVLWRRSSRQSARCPFNTELDAIVLKAISLHPRDRYGSAGELAADVQAYLHGRPTTAGCRRSASRKQTLAVTTVGVSLAGLAAWLAVQFATVAEPLSVRGLIWCDDNGDGLVQPQEPGIAGVTVYADLNANGKLDTGEDGSPAEPTAVSDNRGQYVLWPGKRPTAIRCQAPPQQDLTFPRSLRQPKDVFTFVGTNTLRRLTRLPGKLPKYERGQDLVMRIHQQVPAIVAFIADDADLNVELNVLNEDQLILGWVQENRSAPFTYLARAVVSEDHVEAIYLGSLPIERNVADVGDIDGDGRMDLLIRSREGVPNAEGNWYLQVCWGKNNGTFDFSTPLQPVAVNQRGMTIWLEDVNGDQILDVIYHLTKWGGYFTFELRAALGQGNGTFEFERSQRLLRGPDDHGLFSFPPMDLDGDGDRDLLLVADDDAQDEGQSYVARNDGQGSYSLLKFIDLVPANESPGQDRSMANQAVFWDIDRDGNPELLILDDLAHDNSVRLYRHLDQALSAGTDAENWPYELVDLTHLWTQTAWPRELAIARTAAGSHSFYGKLPQQLDFGLINGHPRTDSDRADSRTGLPQGDRPGSAHVSAGSARRSRT